MTDYYTFLYPSSVWIVNRLKKSKVRTHRPCSVCQIDLLQRDDYPGQYIKLKQQKDCLCLRCAFRLASHPIFKKNHTLTYEEIMSSDFNMIEFLIKFKQIYTTDRFYKELIRKDRQKEGSILTRFDFDKYSAISDAEAFYTRFLFTYDPITRQVLDRIEKGEVVK